MAVKNAASSKIILKVENGLGKDGKVRLAQRTFQHINPELSDDDAYTIGTALGNLQSRTVDSVARTDSASLIAG